MTKRIFTTALYIIAGLSFANAETVHDTIFRVYSKITPRSVVSRSLAGAGSAMPQSDFQGFINPALTTAGNGGRGGGTLSVGYGWDNVFDKVILPFGAVFIDNNGAMGVYYSYLNGEISTVHDAMINFSWGMFKHIQKPGNLDGGLNIRYERSRTRLPRGIESGNNGEEDGLENLADTVNISHNASNILFDFGFYQQHILPGIDFSFVLTNFAGYRWNDIDGEDKTSGWFGWRHCSMVAGLLYTFPLWGAAMRIPFDVEMTGLFTKSASNSYIMRTGLEALIAKMYSLRFGYARSPDNFADLIADFDYKNLFYGGVGINVRPVKFDFFVGKDEFGATATYFY